MKKILKYLLFVLTFCVVFFISFKINIHRLEFAPMKLMETEWDDSVGTVYVDLDYENENGNTYNLYVPANLDKEKEQYLILYIHGGSFNSGAKGDGDIWCRYYASKGYLTASVDYTLQNQGKEASLFLMNEEIENAVKAIKKETKALYIETPSNPTMQVTDLRAMKALAEKYGLLLIVDNTFLSPYFQNPIDLGADLVVHSGTKYLGGHNDALAGFLCSASKDLADKIRYIYKTTGGCLSPFESFLLIRGIKTLSVRMERQQENALKIANWLKEQEEIKGVYYVGLPEHPGYEINKSQARGFGGMISFHTDTAETAKRILERVKVISYAESLGGVESLITYPMLQTHGDVPAEIRERLGITDNFLRMSVGIENGDDLIEDLAQALKGE